MTGPADRAARERIRTSLDETLVVEAAAGTGKTTALVGRLVNVLAAGRGTVESIVAVTFTDAAAGELKLRLRAGLETERQRTGAPDRRRHLGDAIARLEEARLGTIHAFCVDLLRERPVEARVDPAFRVAEDSEARDLYDRAFDAWMQTCLDTPPEGVRRALSRPNLRDDPDGDGRPTERLRRAGWDLATWRHLGAPWRRPPFDRQARIAALADRLRDLVGQLRTCARRDDRLFADTEAARQLCDDVEFAEREQPRDVDALESMLVALAHDTTFRQPRPGSDRNYRGGAARADILRRHAAFVAALDEFERDADADLAAALQAEFRAALDRYDALKTQQGVLDFTDLLVKTRDLLRDRADVRAAMQRRFTHIFVDEFQDTDPLQVEILLLLAAADPAVSDWRDVAPVPGKLFAVGDPKQSIYRFRGADVGMYQAAKVLLCGRGATLLELTTSFRAVPPLQHLVNRAFRPVMAKDRRTFQAAYIPLAPHRPARDQVAIVALPVPSPYGRHGGVTKKAIGASVPHAVAAFVDWLIHESGWTVTERDQQDSMPVEARHVCLLFRRFSDRGSDSTHAYVDALEARGIRQLLVGGKSFHARQEVESLRTVLTAIERPDDQLAVFASLKGPFFAIGDAELLEWRHGVGRLHPYRVPAGEAALPERLAPIARALTLLRALHRRRNGRPVEETINDLFAATRAHAGLVLWPHGEQALANAMRVADLARAYEATGGLSFRGFVERLERDAGGEAPEAPILEEGSEGVRIMTVHKAKGLEFPVVILADPIANLAWTRASRHVDNDAALCALRLTGWAPWDLLDHETDELDRERAEGLRIAYVAATRARDLLVIPALGDDPFGGGWQAADDSWMAAVQRALYPVPAMRRDSTAPSGCPAFGDDGVVHRPPGESAGPRTVRPGLHALGETAETRYGVVWWDAHALRLDAPPAAGIRGEDLIADAGGETVATSLRAYEEWRQERDRVRSRGRRPGIVVETVAGAARQGAPDLDEAAAAVQVLDANLGIVKPGGRRFGTLVHAILATVALDASPEQVAAAAVTHGRIVGAPDAEIAVARRVVEGVLAHPLLRRAHTAWAAGKCRRETPVTWLDRDGKLIEGVLDLAFEEEDAWTILDFKTDAEIGGDERHYRRQVSLYAAAVARATAKKANGILFQI